MISTLCEQLHQAEIKLAGLKARKQSWENRLLEYSTAGEEERSQATFQLRDTVERITAAERAVKACKHKLERAESTEHDDMRHPDELFPSAMVPPHSGWRLVCFRTLTIAGKVVPRGSEITVEQLSQMANAPTLLSGGHIRWQPPQAARPAPAPRPSPASPVAPSLDAIEQCRIELQRICRVRHCSMAEAEDLVDFGIWQRAQRRRGAEAGPRWRRGFWWRLDGAERTWHEPQGFRC